MTNTLSSLITRAKELERKATKGPWTKSQSFAGATIYAGSPQTGAKGHVASFDSGDYTQSQEQGHANAGLSALLRNLAPALFAERDALREALEKIANGENEF